ncbi:hypothetical protein F441_13931, partial [Phytophthora nicotianae CJ01A1]
IPFNATSTSHYAFAVHFFTRLLKARLYPLHKLTGLGSLEMHFKLEQ